MKLLSDADRALGRLDGAITTLPDPDLFVYMYVRREAVVSSQIEGTQSSLQDLVEAEASIYSRTRPGDVAEVINYVRAMRLGLERLEKLPVSMRLIREIHGELLKGVRGSQYLPGEIRTSQNWIGGATIREAAFVPPPPGDLPAALSNLELFLHSEGGIPILIKVGMAHAQFETIHPFLDGNGRIGRLLITFLLCEREILNEPVLYLSAYFKRRRSEYYDRLQRVRDHGDWEGWIAFFLNGVLETSRDAAETTRRILLLREQHREEITEHFGRGSGNGHRVLEALFSNPVLSVVDVQDITSMSYQGANKLVKNMVKLGILREVTGQYRHRKYIYWDYVRLFDDPEPSQPESPMP